MLIAFKISSKKRIGVGKYEHRDLREYFKIWDEKYTITDFICKYDGDTYAMTGGRRSPLELGDATMPFRTRQVLTGSNTF
jgi:hypothetical protein